MFRLTLLLCAGMLAALLIAGEDRGQMRPGLAAADQKPVPDSAVLATAVEAERPASEPLPEVVVEPAPVIAAAEPEPTVEPTRDVVQVVEEPVFTLSALPTETVPGADQPRTQGEGTIWYVTASSVNVREAPSTDSAVLGTLETGEAAMMVQSLDGEWGRIVIQGDGLEGYVALRFLSPEVP